MFENLSEISDIELIDKAVENNDQSAFFILHERYKTGLRKHISNYIQDNQDIEDICIISFQKAFKELKTYNKQHKFSTWLYRIGRNTAYDYHDREKIRGKLGRKDVINDNNEQMDIADDSSPEEDVIMVQNHDMLLKSIESLPEHYKTVTKSCFIDNMGYKEIAEKENIPINTVKTRINRAKNMLIKKMKEQEEQ